MDIGICCRTLGRVNKVAPLVIVIWGIFVAIILLVYKLCSLTAYCNPVKSTLVSYSSEENQLFHVFLQRFHCCTP
jgi:hypothetical protein